MIQLKKMRCVQENSAGLCEVCVTDCCCAWLVMVTFSSDVTQEIHLVTCISASQQPDSALLFLQFSLCIFQVF
ncbi:hypothetical protein GN956_G13489 [Arapaima gigas]